MYKIFTFMFVSVFFIACSPMQTNGLTPNKKAFAQEDTYIMFALRAEQVKNYTTSAKLFKELYKKSEKKEYFYRSLQNSYFAKDYATVLEDIEQDTQNVLEAPILARLKIGALVELEKMDAAKILSRSLAKHTKETNDYLLVADVYIKNSEFSEAAAYLESVYTKQYDEKILDKLAVLLYLNLDRKKEAIAQLETHSRMHGCSDLICNRLIGIYSNENNIDGLLSVYKRKYNVSKDSKIAKKIIQICGYKKDYVQLMNFLEDSHEDDELILQLYISAKSFAKAHEIAHKLYKTTNNIDFLGQSAIYEYEANKEKLNKKILTNVVEKLDTVIKTDKDPLYKNYLGYILIDHNLDIQKGMQYIKDVLKIKPDSGYYLDSLAWGYYKLGQCKKAKKIMLKVKQLEGGDDPEVDLHIEMINKCLKNLKRNK